MVQLASILNGVQFFDNLGKPLAGGLIYTYTTGTTTPINTWANPNATVLNTNPIVLDSSGRLQTEIWLAEGTIARFRLTDEFSTVLEEWDDVGGILSGLSITSADVITALGFQPVNRAGDTMLGQLLLNGDPNSAMMAATKQYVDNQLTALRNELITLIDAATGDFKLPVGEITTFAVNNAPAGGYLPCDGAAVSRETYADLFAVIGTTFGPGDSVVTFNVPDLRGRFVRGIDNGAGRDPGRTFASVQADDFLAHNHIYYANTKAQHNDGRTLYDPTYTLGGGSRLFFPFVGSDSNTNASYLLVSHTAGQIPSAANHPGLETRPKNIALAYFIKT